jgi:WD40 repeat protein
VAGKESKLGCHEDNSSAMILTTRCLPSWGLALLMLSACAVSPQEQARQERKQAEKENSRALVYGASGAAFSPNGTQVAVANREQIWIADTASGRVVAHLRSADAGPFGGSKGLEFINEQRLVIGAQGSIMIWDLKEGLVTHRLSMPNHLDTPRAMAWSEATETLALSSGISRDPVSVVSLKTDGFGPLQDVPGFEGVPADLVFSDDGLYLAAAGDESGVNIREVATGEFIGELPAEGFVNSLEAFGNNKLLVSGTDIVVWSFLSEEEVQQFDNPDLQGQIDGQVAKKVGGGIAIGALAIVALPLVILTGDPDPFLMVANAVSAGANPVERAAQPWCGRSNSISPDGQWLADIYPGITEEIIGVYDMESGELVRKLNPRGEYSCVVKFSPNGKQLLITTSKVARLYDTSSWKHIDLDLGKP